MKTIGERLREIRETRGFPQKQVADLIGVKRPNYSKIENSKQGLNAHQIKLFCEFFDVSADYILDITIDNKKVMSKYKNLDIKKKLQDIIETLD